MTYCIGMLLQGGLVMIADSRTNAGVDNIASYRKLHILANDEERLIAVATSGNLSITQSALALLGEEPTGEEDEPLAEMTSMFRVAQKVGEVLGRTRDGMLKALESSKVPTAASLLLGGRIGDEPLRLFHIYSAGNFVECHAEQPFMQIGETKYGKPILDRALRHDTLLEEAVKIGLISFDSTIRSNLAVGQPIDVLAVATGDTARPTVRRVDRDDAYFADLSARWSMLLNEALDTIPAPPFMREQPA